MDRVKRLFDLQSFLEENDDNEVYKLRQWLNINHFKLYKGLNLHIQIDTPISFNNRVPFGPIITEI